MGDVKITEPLDFDSCPPYSPRYDELMGSIKIYSLNPRQNSKSSASAMEALNAAYDLEKACNNIQSYANIAVNNLRDAVNKCLYKSPKPSKILLDDGKIKIFKNDEDLFPILEYDMKEI